MSLRATQGVENCLGQTGNHKGCPYTVNAIFRTMTMRKLKNRLNWNAIQPS